MNMMLSILEGQLRCAQGKIKVLEEGACRFNCRTSKENWLAGYQNGLDDPREIITYNDMEKAYHEWKRRQKT